jgi:hypothetical protein
VSLRKSKGKAKTVHGCDWAVKEDASGRIFEFGCNTPFELFWKTIGAVEGDIWWYRGIQMKSDMAFSDKDDFNQLRDITMASWAQSRDYVSIQKAVEGDFEG